MKQGFRKIAFILAITLIVSLGSYAVYAIEGAVTEVTDKIAFDFDNSAARNTGDVVLLLRKIDGLQDDAMANADADINGDGVVTVYDAVQLLRYMLLNEYCQEDSLKIVSYNIKAGFYDVGNTLETIAQTLIDMDADIVGLQEVDSNTIRSSLTGDQLATLAEMTGYQYYQYTPVIYLTTDELNHTAVTDPTERNKVYGHGILSKYPIKNHTVIRPEAQYGELRAIARHEIDVNGKTVAFYNSHLSGKVSVQQYQEVQDNYMVKDQYSIFVADTNTSPENLYTCMNERFELLTEIQMDREKAPIDHIIVSKDTMTWRNYEYEEGSVIKTMQAETVSSYAVPEFTWDSIVRTTASDHSLRYAEIDLND